MVEIRRIVFSVVFLIVLAVLCADPLMDGVNTRERMMQNYREEIALASSYEVSPENIGEWYDILETALFMIARRTEIFRGTMRLIITNKKDAHCFLYPDGTFLVTTGLLDYIDSYLFLEASTSARRIRNFNTEREHFFVPIAALCAAKFALNDYPSFFKRQSNKEILFTIDVLAMVLLEIAGYPSSLVETWLTRLEHISSEPENQPLFKSFLTETVTPLARIDQLEINAEAEIRLYEELSGILFALHNRKGTLDARNALENLRQLFPQSPYILRLYALVSHQAWLNTIEKKAQELAPVLPAAVYDTSSVYPFFQGLDTLHDVEDDEQEDYFLRTAPHKDNSRLYDQTKRAYRDYLNILYEAGMASCYAHLLASSPLEHERQSVLAIAKQAEVFHSEADDKTPLVNYASLLYLVTKDYTKAASVLSAFFAVKEREKNSRKLFLTTGMPIDERLVRCNYIRMLNRMHETDAVKKEKQSLALLFADRLYAESAPADSIMLRNVSLGASIDELLAAWNEPSSIIYNYYSERWLYRLFNTEAVIRSRDQGGTVMQLTVKYPSPLTLFNSIRTGDTRDSFEQICGKPLYYSADSAIYFQKGTILQVVYGNNKVRSITLRKYQ